MKLREKIKRFWTLDVHGHEGFTLVELIIVIAILAILSSVAVVGYSSYVEKANKQADKTLVSEIVNALTLQYYSEQGGDYVAAVVLTETGADAAQGSKGEAAMEAAYGTNWRTSLKLSYTKWGSGATATAEVLDHFTSATGATKDIYNGTKHASFEDDTEELFDLVEETAKLYEGADTVYTAAMYTADSDVISATDFAAAWANKTTAWNNDTLPNPYANAAVIKARNTAIAGYIQKELLKVEGITAEEAAYVYNLFANRAQSNGIPIDVVGDISNIQSGVADYTAGRETELKWRTINTAYGAYFTDAANTDGLAYYAMMETVLAVGEPSQIDDYWSSMSNAMDTYASIARGEIDLDSIADAYSILPEGTGSAIIILFTAEGGTYTITINPSGIWDN